MNSSHPVWAPVKWFRYRTHAALTRHHLKPVPKNHPYREYTLARAKVAVTTGYDGFSHRSLNGKVREIHYWHDGKRTDAELLHLFGHELGHLSGRMLVGERSQDKEENRADEYAMVAVMAHQRLKKDRRRR